MPETFRPVYRGFNLDDEYSPEFLWNTGGWPEHTFDLDDKIRYFVSGRHLVNMELRGDHETLIGREDGGENGGPGAVPYALADWFVLSEKLKCIFGLFSKWHGLDPF